MSARAWTLVASLALVGCGGSGEGTGEIQHPAAVEEGDVDLPADAPAAVKRCRALLDSLVDPLKLAKDLHTHRPVADELAIVAGKVGELATSGYAPEIAQKLGARGKEIANEATNLAKYLRAGDAAKANTVHQALQRLCTRLEGDLPRGTAPKDE